MLAKDTLRKADIFSGTLIFLFGLFVVYQALQMPMKDTYGGVQNVWYVSPAIFPLFIGAIIALLGAALTVIALKSVGRQQLASVFHYLASPELIAFLKQPATIRFYAIVLVFSSFIFVMIPRVDFFLAAVFFLMVFISMFYFDDDQLLFNILLFFITVSVLLIIFFAAGFDALLADSLAYPGDWLMLAFIAAFAAFDWGLVKNRTGLRRKYRTCLLLAIIAPFTVGIIFKFLLLVPMPFEGAVVELLDTIWYYDY
jgi:hypothetical protein